MESNSKKEPLLNTTLGLVPWLTFVIFQNFISYSASLIAGAATWIALLIFYSVIRKNQVIRILLNISAGVLAIQAICPFLHIPDKFTTVFCEIVLLIFLWFFNNSEHFVKKKYLSKTLQKDKTSISVALNELFYVTRICWNTLFVHLSIVFIYLIMLEEVHLQWLDKFIYKQLGIILIVSVILFEHIRLSIIKRKLYAEEWLPVCNETGRVIGKVAKTVSFKSKNQFLHPVVRVALIYKGLLYLMERPSNYLSEPEKIDHPFETYVKYGQELNDAVNNIIQSRSKASDMKTRFVFKYLYKTPHTNRLIYLYTLPVHEEETMSKIQLKSGKLWTEKQIEENLNKGVFSECFEKEYEVLKNTILMAEKLVFSGAN